MLLYDHYQRYDRTFIIRVPERNVYLNKPRSHAVSNDPIVK
jgi:hypothetical protein